MSRFSTYLIATASKNLLLVLLCVLVCLQVEVAWGEDDNFCLNKNSNPDLDKNVFTKKIWTRSPKNGWRWRFPSGGQIYVNGVTYGKNTATYTGICPKGKKRLYFGLYTLASSGRGVFKILVRGKEVFRATMGKWVWEKTFTVGENVDETKGHGSSGTWTDNTNFGLLIKDEEVPVIEREADYQGNGDDVVLIFEKPYLSPRELILFTFYIEEELVIDSPTNKVCKGENLQLTGNCLNTATWTSSNPAIATVNATTGLVTAKAVGTTDITYKLKNSQDCSATKTITVVPKPTCNITGDNQIAPNTTATYTAPTGANYQYTWTATGATIVEGVNNQRTVQVQTGANNTNFTLNLEISNGACISTCNKPIQVIDDEAPTFTAPDDLFLCVNSIEEANFDQTTNGDINNPPDYYEFNSTNKTILDITGINDNNCNANTISWNIIPDNNIGQSITYEGQPSENLEGKKLALDTPYAEKTYTIRYNVKDCNGNIARKATHITIKPRPKIDFVNN